MKILKYSVISDINKGDVFISDAINFIDKQIATGNVFTNQDILFKKFNLEKRLNEQEVGKNTFYKVKRRNKLMSYLVLLLKVIIFTLKDKKRVEEQIRMHECVFIGGGNLFMETNGGDLFYRSLQIVKIAKSLNKKVIIYGVGLGPFEFPYKKRLAKIINMSDRFYVRDYRNKEICDELDIRLNKEVCVALDPAFIVSDIHQKKNLEKKYIGLNFMNLQKIVTQSKFDLNVLLSNLEEIYVEYKLPYRIINTSYGEDLSISTLISEKLKKINIDVSIFNIKELKDLTLAFSDLKFFLASRMHSSIFSMSYEVPTLVYSWHPKIDFLQKYLFSEKKEKTLILSENFDSQEVIHKIENYSKEIKINKVIEANKLKIYKDYANLIKFI